MGNDIFLIAVGFIPTLIIVAITQYYLWEKSNRDFLLNKYESAIKFLDWENYKIIEYCTLINNMATRNPEKVDDITYDILTKEFENIDEDIRSLTLEMCNISLVSKYDHSLEKLVGNYAEARMRIIKNTTSIYSEACINKEWKLEGY
ncbi:MAG: hypothetical protein N2A97_02500 [Thermodesulfobacteriales bacterium]